MKNAFNLLLFLILFSSKAFSQSNFEISFGTSSSDVGYSIHQTFDGKYIVTGSTDSSGINNVYLALLDIDGTVLWTKSVGGNLDDVGSAILQTSDSGFIIAGTTSSYGNGNSDVYLIKVNGNGDTLWTKTFGGSNFDYCNSMQTTFDGGFILAGQESSSGAGIAHIYMIKTNATGDTSWTRSFPMAAWTGAKGIVQTQDSGYLAFGDFENNLTGVGDYDLICLKTNSQGDSLWTKTYEDSSYHDYAQAINKTSDGGFIIAGIRESLVTFESESSKILRLDANGDTLWSKVFGGSYTYSVGDITQTPDSGFIITGYSYDTLLLRINLLITKLSPIGDSLWTKFFYGLFTANAKSIEATADGGMIICGSTTDSTFVQSDVYVLKTNGNGDTLNCTPIIVSQPTDTTIYENLNAIFTITTSSNPFTIQWQTDSLGTFVDIHDGGIFSGTNSDTLWITGAPLSMDGNQFRCFVIDSFVCTDTSTTVNLIVNSSIGISEIAFKQYTFYPNPVTKYIVIEGPLPELVVLCDIFGKTISEYKSEQKIDASGLANGVYYLKIYSNTNKNKNVEIYRFLKN